MECGPPLDLMAQASVKAFAQAILKRPGGLHILVNNAGLGYCKKSFTEEGVGMLTQVGVCTRGGRLAGHSTQPLPSAALSWRLLSSMSHAAAASMPSALSVRLHLPVPCISKQPAVCIPEALALSASVLCFVLCCVFVLQVNHLGPYTLTRMLEPKLIASKARVVNVVSVTHRIDKIRCGTCRRNSLMVCKAQR